MRPAKHAAHWASCSIARLARERPGLSDNGPVRQWQHKESFWNLQFQPHIVNNCTNTGLQAELTVDNHVSGQTASACTP